jgi:hypothetical protein
MKSENGWPVIKSSSDRNLTVIRIPNTGTPGIPLRVQKECAPLLAHIAYLVHTEVSDLKENNKPGFQDEGGYNYRVIAGSTRYSNHASGTAIDLNWQKWPMFKRRMNRKQRMAAEVIASEFSDVIRWGGNYRTSVDEMHWEIKPGVSLMQVKKFIKDYGIKKDGTLAKPNTKKQEIALQQCRVK